MKVRKRFFYSRLCAALQEGGMAVVAGKAGRVDQAWLFRPEQGSGSPAWEGLQGQPGAVILA